MECFNASSEILKTVIRKSRCSVNQRRLFCFHSWRAVIRGIDRPLDELETAYFDEKNLADLHLVSNRSHAEWIWERYRKPAIILPLTAFQDPDVYQDHDVAKDFDIIFSSLMTPEHHSRKRADLLYEILALEPKLRVAWIGGYHPYERWKMENSFNSHFHDSVDAPADWEALWTEEESFKCWYHGGGVFRNEIEKDVYLNEQITRAKTAGLNIQFYMNLPRRDVVDILSRSRVSLSLASLDQWPRCIMEAMACGTPVVCSSDLIAGKQAVDESQGVIADPDPQEMLDAIAKASALDRKDVRSSYYEEFGIANSVRKINKALEEAGINDWGEIVSIQRPEETRVKKAIRSSSC